MRPITRLARLTLLPLLVALAVAAQAPRAPHHAPAPLPGTAIDSGAFVVSVNGHNVGREDFTFQQIGDSVITLSRVVRLVEHDGRIDTLLKQVVSHANAFDFSLRSYGSTQFFMGQRYRHAIHVYDTTYTGFRETPAVAGEGDAHSLPPGKAFVLDPQVFANFEAIARNLHGIEFKTRPVTLIAIGASADTAFEVSAEHLGYGMVRWAGRTTRARHLLLGDEHARYDIWASPEGHILRIEHKPSGLRVEREVRRVTPPRKPPRAR